MVDNEQKQAARKFAAFWKDKGYEKGQSQLFWISLLRDVFGVEHPEEFIVFEEQVHLDHTSFIDGTIPTTKVLIEQKGLGKDLNKPIKQSDGTLLNPFQQAKRYITELPLSQHPRWVVTCNFAEFYVYDMERPGGASRRRYCLPIWKENIIAFNSSWIPAVAISSARWKFPLPPVKSLGFFMTLFSNSTRIRPARVHSAA